MSQDFATNKGMLTSAFKRQFHDTFDILCAQTESVLQGTVKDRGVIQGASFTINDMGTVEMKKSTGRFQDTDWSIPESGTRLALMEDYDLFVPIEPKDAPKLSARPDDSYMRLCLQAEHRQRDRTIYAALGASINRKIVDGETYTPTPLPATQIIGASALPFNKAKLARARALFRKNHVDKDHELYMVYDSNMLEQILVDDELTKWDKDTIQAIQDGDVAKKWGGFIWLPYEELADGATPVTTNRTFAYAKGGVHFGRVSINDFDITVRGDKKNVKQIGGITSYGAGRANEQKVVAIDFVV